VGASKLAEWGAAYDFVFRPCRGDAEGAGVAWMGHGRMNEWVRGRKGRAHDVLLYIGDIT
jgi:hypothetical protein